jgi:hypothetical protein
MPLSYTSPTDDDPVRVESRPDLKCPGCSQCYQWQEFAGWAPVGFPTTMTRFTAQSAHRSNGIRRRSRQPELELSEATALKPG